MIREIPTRGDAGAGRGARAPATMAPRHVRHVAHGTPGRTTHHHRDQPRVGQATHEQNSTKTARTCTDNAQPPGPGDRRRPRSRVAPDTFCRHCAHPTRYPVCGQGHWRSGSGTGLSVWL